MKIKITLADIRKAKEAARKFKKREGYWLYARSKTCPLALALRRILKRDDVCVGHSILIVGSQSYNLPTKISNFIKETDNKKDRIRPRELEIPIE